MMKIKLKIPKIRVNPAKILLLALAMVLTGELYVLYYALYAPVEEIAGAETLSVSALKDIDIDLVEYNKIKTWIETRRNYVVPPYSLEISTTTASTTGLTGRENPFADY